MIHDQSSLQPGVRIRLVEPYSALGLKPGEIATVVRGPDNSALIGTITIKWDSPVIVKTGYTGPCWWDLRAVLNTYFELVPVITDWDDDIELA